MVSINFNGVNLSQKNELVTNFQAKDPSTNKAINQKVKLDGFERSGDVKADQMDQIAYGNNKGWTFFYDDEKPDENGKYHVIIWKPGEKDWMEEAMLDKKEIDELIKKDNYKAIK